MSTGRLLVICAGVLLVPLDSASTTVALPSIRATFGTSDARVAWVATAYAVGFGAVVLAGGRLADALGPRRVFRTGLLVVVIGALAATTAQTLGWLVASRLVQGTGAGLVVPAGVALISAAHPHTAGRSRAVGVLGVCLSGGFVLGAMSSGVAVSVASWRLAMVATGLIAVIAVAGPVDPVFATSPADRQRRFDFLGAACGSAAVAIAVGALASTGPLGWHHALVVGGLCVAVSLTACFIAIERRHPVPLVDLAILGRRDVAWAAVVAILAVGGYSSALFALTLYVDHALGFTPMDIALPFAIVGAAAAIGSHAAPRAIASFGIWRALAMSLVIQSAATLALALAACIHVLAVLIGAAALAGLGHLAAAVMLLQLGTRSADVDEHGVAAGLFFTAQQIGTGIMVAFAGGILGDGPRPSAAHTTTSVARPDGQFVAAFAFAGAVVGVAVVLVLAAQQARAFDGTRDRK